jgi:hypothetical protein
MTDHRPPDLQRLIGEVAARHNILLKPDDAAFALVTINRLILEDVVKDLLEKVREILVEFELAAGQVQTRAGSLIARDVKEATAAIRGELAKEVGAAGKQAQALVDAVHRAHSKAVVEKWVGIGIACAALLFASGFLVGRLVRF